MATGWGVATTITLVLGSSRATVIDRSPVPGGRFDYETVERAPGHLPHQIFEGLGDHGAAPDHRLVFAPGFG
jgi:hypothetical protein